MYEYLVLVSEFGNKNFCIHKFFSAHQSSTLGVSENFVVNGIRMGVGVPGIGIGIW